MAKDAIAINTVTTDSREEAKKSLFIPLVGEKFDGHNHIKQAFNNGAVATLWEKHKKLPDFLPTDFPVFFVNNTYAALEKLASTYRNEIDPIVIGITGSNGKTTTKDLVSAVVKSSYRTHFTYGNFNNHIGVPKTILSMPRDTEVLVLEMGMNHFGEIEKLSTIAKPDYAVITNIGESHIEFLGSRAGIAKAKLEITAGLKQDGLLIIDGDEKLLEHVHNKQHTITCGFLARNTVRIDEVSLNNNETSFRLTDGQTFSIPLLGKHHAQNALYAVTIGRKLGIQDEKIKEALKHLKQTGMRFEIKKGMNGAAIINDTYNASPTSMIAAIDVVKQMNGYQEKVLVLGDIFELGKHSKELHKSVALHIDERITALFTYGNDAEVITSEVKKQHPTIHCKHFTEKEELISALHIYVKKDALLLFKASRGMQFEQLVEAFL